MLEDKSLPNLDDLEAVEGSFPYNEVQLDSDNAMIKEIIALYPNAATAEYKESLKNKLFDIDVHVDCGMHYRALSINGEDAAGIILHFNNNNRDHRPALIERYTRAMKANQWCRTPQGIGFYKDHQLADGQHRLFSAALANHTIDVFCQFDFEVEDTHALDAGGARNCSDALHMASILRPKVKDPMVKFLMRLMSYQCEIELFDDPSDRSAVTFKNPTFTNADYINFAKKSDIVLEKTLRFVKALLKNEDVNIVQYQCLSRSEINIIVASLFYYSIPEHLVSQFLIGVLTGRNSYEGSVESHLKDALLISKNPRLVKDRLSVLTKRHILFKCFAFFCKKECVAAPKKAKTIVSWSKVDVPVCLRELSNEINNRGQ